MYFSCKWLHFENFLCKIIVFYSCELHLCADHITLCLISFKSTRFKCLSWRLQILVALSFHQHEMNFLMYINVTTVSSIADFSRDCRHASLFYDLQWLGFMQLKCFIHLHPCNRKSYISLLLLVGALIRFSMQDSFLAFQKDSLQFSQKCAKKIAVEVRILDRDFLSTLEACTQPTW